MITAATRQRILQRGGWLCQLCREAPAVSVDHIWPQILGGTDDDANLQAACKPCNTRKGGQPPDGMLPLFSATDGERVTREGIQITMTFRPGSDAELLEALAFSLRISRNEVLRRGLHALAGEHQPHISEVIQTLAKLKKGTTT